MNARAPTAFMLSLALHAGVILAIIALAFAVQHRQPAPVQIFELVAGPPTDLMATEAPALGSADGQVEVKIHEKAPKSEAAPEESVAAAPPETGVSKKTSAKNDAKISYRDFVAKHGQPSQPKAGAAGSARAVKAPQIKTHGIPDGVIGGSSASHGGGGGKALTAPPHTAFEAYTSRLVAVLRQCHQKPPGLSDLLSADVECLIAADGTIGDIHVVRSSGNEAFDQSCLEAFKRMGSIGPTPDGKNGTWRITFHMVDPE